MENSNPFATSIRENEEVQSSSDEAENERLSYIGWIALVAINVPLPLFFAMSMISPSAGIGVGLAFIPMFVFGYWICNLPRKRGKPLFIGGSVVALFQFLPLLHIFAGVTAISITQPIDRFFDNSMGADATEDVFAHSLQTVVGGFLATLITGTILMLSAAVIGYGIRFTTPEKWWRPERSKEKGE